MSESKGTLPGRFIAIMLVLSATSFLTGCEYAFSDAATRIRYALLAQSWRVQASDTPVTVTVYPDHFPEGCDSNYRVVLSPYKGGKQVPVGDIFVHCQSGQRYYTGFGSEQIYVTKEIFIEKRAGEAVTLSLHKTASGSEIVDMK